MITEQLAKQEIHIENLNRSYQQECILLSTGEGSIQTCNEIQDKIESAQKELAHLQQARELQLQKQRQEQKQAEINKEKARQATIRKALKGYEATNKKVLELCRELTNLTEQLEQHRLKLREERFYPLEETYFAPLLTIVWQSLPSYARLQINPQALSDISIGYDEDKFMNQFSFKKLEERYL